MGEDKMAARNVVKQMPAWKQALSRWAYSKSYFPELGLMRDDCLMETPAVVEAIKRLPPYVYDERMFRITRALQLSCKKEILHEEDVRYLTPIIKEVEAEWRERRDWESQ